MRILDLFAGVGGERRRASPSSTKAIRMTPLHIEIAKSILATPRNFASDEFTLLAKNRGYNHSASAGAVLKLKDRWLIYKVGEKRCKHAIGKNLIVYRIVAGNEPEFQTHGLVSGENYE